MVTLLRLTACIAVTAVVAGTGSLWYQTYVVGRLYENGGPFIVILGGAAPLVTVLLGVLACRLIMTTNLDLE